MGKRTKATANERSLHERIAAMKQASRDADTKALAEGRVTVKDLMRRGGYYLSQTFEPDMANAPRVNRRGGRHRG
jgi:hypothetical protein